MLNGGTGPLISISQSRRGCWEQAVLGNDLAGGPRDGEGRDGSAQRRGREKGGGKEGLVQRVRGVWRVYEAGKGRKFTARKL